MSQSTAQSDLLNSDDAKDSDQGITKIVVQGYKSLFTESSIEVGNLTILAGTNSSGKSSMMQPLLLMKQTLEAPFDPGALLLNGPNVEFTLMNQLLSSVAGQIASQFSVGLEVDGYLFIKNSYGKSHADYLEITETSIQDDEGEITFSPGISQQEILERIPQPDEGDEFLASFLGEEVDFEEMTCEVNRERCF